MGGIQAQYAPSAYVGLWSRVEDFRRDTLTRALGRKTLVQGTSLRSTIHIMSRADYWPFVVAVQASQQTWWLRVTKGPGVDAQRMVSMAEDARRMLAAGPLRSADLAERLREAGHSREAIAGVGLWAPMVRVPPSGTWDRRRADLYADAALWVGPRGSLTEKHAIRHILRRYLAAFGPASVESAASWAGVPIGLMRSAADSIPLRTFHQADGPDLVDVPRGPLPDPDTPAPVRMLGTWEALLLVHARGTGVLAEDLRDVVFHTKNPHSVNTFLVDGTVAGTWRHEGGRITVQPFEPLPRRVRGEVDEEADRLRALFNR
jgi:hypothetical protein